ncbi:MAG TPA: choice-of-anchor tandem repeat NxxGxxAF-containing protein [Phycisphaerales bacterium]|nr:choice-of-anchor tandem repeat NxxGxxAF-containing protein [Phycisphaerales bacterium]
MTRNPFTRTAALAGAAAIGASAHSLLAQEYSFTKVADSALDDFDPFSTGAPSLSDTGYVAFGTLSADQSSSRVLRSGADLARPLVVIGDDQVNNEIGSFFNTVSVNNAGQVSMWATISGPVFERILRGNGGPLELIAEASDNEMFNFMSVITSISDSGTVAWQGELNRAGFPQGLFTGNGGPVDTIFSTDSSDFTSSFAGPMINNAGQIAFRASTTTSDGDAIFRYDGGSSFVTIVDSSGPFSSFFDDEPAINDLGDVAVIAFSDDFSTSYVLVGNGVGAAVAVADTSGALESINNAGINDQGQVAFSATFDDFFTQGIFTGPDLVADRVIGTGDELDGSVVTGVAMFREGLNDSGQIAFLAFLDDGRAVVGVATPDCAADFNGDGVVDTRDVLAFLNAWNADDSASDCTGDGTLDTRDVLCFLNLWNAGC